MNDMRQITPLGREIESSSFSIVDREVGPHNFPEREWEIVRRVIHATADFEFKDLMEFHSESVQAGIDAIRSGCPIVVDVKMISSGLNQNRLDAFGCRTYNFISDEDVIEAAKNNNSTRAIESITKAKQLGVLDKAIVAIGNAPTALLELCRLVVEKEAKPALIIGVPVGFVSAAESKQRVLDIQYPSIVAKGRKGGSPIAVAIIHALLLLTQKEVLQ